MLLKFKAFVQNLEYYVIHNYSQINKDIVLHIVVRLEIFKRYDSSKCCAVTNNNVQCVRGRRYIKHGVLISDTFCGLHYFGDKIVNRKYDDTSKTVSPRDNFKIYDQIVRFNNSVHYKNNTQDRLRDITIDNTRYLIDYKNKDLYEYGTRKYISNVSKWDIMPS